MYKKCFGITLNKRIDFSETIVFILTGDIEEWNKIEVKVNGILSIEEYLIKYDISKYKICFNDNKKMVLYIKFFNSNILKYKHEYEVYDSKNNLLYKKTLNIVKNKLVWKITFQNYDNNWYKFNYIINGVLCISDIIGS